jgi:hypothetical protein
MTLKRGRMANAKKITKSQALTLLLIERNSVSEELELIGYTQEKAAPMVVRGKSIMRLSIAGLTDKTQLIAS